MNIFLQISHNDPVCEMGFHESGLDNLPQEQDFDMGLLSGDSGNTRGMFSFQKRNLETKEAEMFIVTPTPTSIWRAMAASSSQSLFPFG